MIKDYLRLFDGAPAGAAGVETGAGAVPETENKSKVVYGIGEEPPDTTTGTETDTPSEEEKEAKRINDYNAFKKEHKDLFQKDIDSVVNKRFKETKGLTETLDKLNPIVREMASRYGLEENDIDGIVKAYTEDPKQDEEYAEKEGLTLEQARKMRELQRYRDAQETAMNRANADATYENWMSQAEELMETYPDFDINEEVGNAEFVKVLSNGFTVQQAYELLHPEAQAKRIRDDIMSKQAANMSKRQKRPSENGVSQGGTVERRSNVKNFTAEDRRRAIEQSMRQGSGSVRFS